MYKPGMSELEVLLYQMDQLISEHSSELANHFNAQGFATSTFASRWFLTLFSAVFPKVCPLHIGTMSKDSLKTIRNSPPQNDSYLVQSVPKMPYSLRAT